MSQPTIRDIYEAVQDLREEIRCTYVTKDEFQPVKLIAFGLVSLILMTVVGAIVAGVIRVQ